MPQFLTEWQFWSMLLTALVAVYGAVLSTYTLCQNRRDKQHRLTVRVSHAVLGGPSGISGPMITITVANPSFRDLTVNPPGLLLPDGRSLIFPYPQSDAQFPHELRQGKSCTIWCALDELKADLRQKGLSGKIIVRGFCDDAVGNRHRGQPFELDLANA